MDTVIENYNNTPNRALDGITPSQAHLKANHEIIFKLNLLKQKGKQEPSDLIIGLLRTNLRSHLALNSQTRYTRCIWLRFQMSSSIT